MTQVSLMAYATAGAFLGLGYFDLYYSLVVIVIAAQRILDTERAALAAVASPARDAVARRQPAARPPVLAHRR
jgi:hypothetical protein